MTNDPQNVRPVRVLRYPDASDASYLAGVAPAVARPIEVRRVRAAGVAGGDSGVLIVLFGVLLPLATVVVELVTRMCATELFDPLPTPLHVALVMCVPLGNFAVWLASRGPCTRRLPLLAAVNGVAIGVALCYAVLFAMLTPFAIIGIVVFGLGLLPLGPLFGFIVALVLAGRLRRAAAAGGVRRVRGAWPGFAAAVALLVATVLPAFVTHHGMKMAASADPARREAGVGFLRTWGSEDEMLEACYWTRANFNPFLPGERWSRGDPEEAQRIFYRVTGAGYEARPSPITARAGWMSDGDWGDGDWEHRGGERVGGLLPGLSVASSRIDGSVNAEASTAYFEWTLEFKNDKSFAQEARCRIALPPDGVVSRLTLWINGEEREAAFGGRAQVRAAYEQVVKVERRDPVLVNYAGPDRVQMQCFPVPAGGLMKVRVGVTAPVRLESLASGAVSLPSFADRNFAIPAGLAHAVWIDSRAGLSASPNVAGLHAMPASSGGKQTFTLQGVVADAALTNTVQLRVPRPADVTAVWFDDPYDKSVGTVVQRVASYTELPPARVALAIDGSASMADVLPKLSIALAELPPGVAVSAVVSADGLQEIEGDAVTVAKRLRGVKCRGGQDSVPALARAWDLAAGHGDRGVVLWVHGAQPMVLQSVESLKQRAENSPGPRLIHLQATPGDNAVAQAVAEFVRVDPLARASGGNVSQDLATLFAGWSTPRERWRLARATGPKPEGPGVRPGDIQIVRLWASEQVASMVTRRGLGQSTDTAAAVALAVRHHLVTPVSGAVVLETKEQYDAAGLVPVTAIPIPPAMWSILLLAPVVWWTTRRRAAHA